MKIAGYLKTSLLDWPGKVSSVIWVVGCNFRCPFCHNRDLVLGNRDLSYLNQESLLADLKKRKKWIDGLVITGGEPTLQLDLADFCKQVKNLGLGVKLDTNGSQPEIIQHLIKEKLVDFIAMDLKNCFQEYDRTVGIKVDSKKIKRSIKIILKSGLEYEFRTTVVPQIHNEESLKQLAKQIRELAGETSWVWQNFVARNCLDKSFEKIKGYSKRRIESWKKEMESQGISIILRGWSG